MLWFTLSLSSLSAQLEFKSKSELEIETCSMRKLRLEYKMRYIMRERGGWWV